jgi:hypothetical protein
MSPTTVDEVLAELAALEDPRARAVNERHGDDHGVNLGRLRAVAKRLRTQQELARQLWATDDTAARLVALLICRPKAFERDELDVMLRGAWPGPRTRIRWWRARAGHSPPSGWRRSPMVSTSAGCSTSSRRG